MAVEITSVENLSAIVLATGALGTAAFGVVEGLKGTSLGLAGFYKLKNLLGNELMKALKHAYGNNCEDYLKAQYRNGRSKGEIGRTLRQGIRIGLPGADTQALAAELPGVNAQALQQAAQAIDSGGKINDDQKHALARFEMSVDARIDAALALAETSYVAVARNTASGFAIIFALIVGCILGFHADETSNDYSFIGLAFLIGVAAIPIAPVAKDIAKALSSAEKALKVKR